MAVHLLQEFSVIGFLRCAGPRLAPLFDLLFQGLQVLLGRNYSFALYCVALGHEKGVGRGRRSFTLLLFFVLLSQVAVHAIKAHFFLVGVCFGLGTVVNSVQLRFDKGKLTRRKFIERTCRALFSRVRRESFDWRRRAPLKFEVPVPVASGSPVNHNKIIQQAKSDLKGTELNLFQLYKIALVHAHLLPQLDRVQLVQLHPLQLLLDRPRVGLELQAFDAHAQRTQPVLVVVAVQVLRCSNLFILSGFELLEGISSALDEIRRLLIADQRNFVEFSGMRQRVSFGYLDIAHKQNITLISKSCLHYKLMMSSSADSPFDYNKCIYQARLHRPSLLVKKQYYLYVALDYIIINSEPYSKHPQLKIPLAPSTLVKWVWTTRKDGRFRVGFHIQSGSIGGQFMGENIVIEYLKETFKQHLIQAQFLDEYKLLNYLDKGNYAQVYACRNLSTEQMFAVKIMDKHKIHAVKNGRESVFNELNVLRSLNHPNLLRLIQAFEDKQKYYFVMQLLEGNSLYKQLSQRSKVKSSELSGLQIRLIMRQILEGVASLAKAGVLHRDLKSENMMFRDKSGLANTLVIADFGLSTFQSEQRPIFTKCGTPGYVAPEVINYKQGTPLYGFAVDIFSVGAIFHLMLMKQPPFPGRSRNTILDKNKNLKIDFKEDKYNVLSQDALALLKKMFQKQPSRRISAQEALQHPFFTEDKPIFKFSKNFASNFEETNLNRNFVNLDKLDESVQEQQDQWGVFDRHPFGYQLKPQRPLMSWKFDFTFRQEGEISSRVKNSIFLYN